MKLYFKVTWRNGAVSVAVATTQVILGDTQGSAVAAPPGVNGSPQSDPELNWFRSKTCENQPRLDMQMSSGGARGPQVQVASCI